MAHISFYMAGKSAPPGAVLARIATRQHGVISRRQILALGVDQSFIERNVAARRLHRLHRGVYAVGHTRLTQRSYWLAAVLACGESSVLSHRSAAALWCIAFLELGRIDVLTPGRGGRPQTRLAIRRTRNLPDTDRSEIDGIPVTTLNRTLLDLAAIATESQLRKAVAEAARQELLDIPSLLALCVSRSGCRGTGALGRIAKEQRGPITATRSPPETGFLAACIRRGFPTPASNVPLAGYEADFLWRHARLVVEIDSRGYHRSWAEQESDRAKDAAIQEAGFNVLRYSQETLDADEEGTFAQIGRFLGL